MRSNDLTGDQPESIRKRLAPAFAYLHKLHARMAEQGFDDCDRLRILVNQAEDGLGALPRELTTLNVDGPGIVQLRAAAVRHGELQLGWTIVGRSDGQHARISHFDWADASDIDRSSL